MLATKQRVRDLLERLPANCSLDDVVYHLYVMQKVEAGLADAGFFADDVPKSVVIRLTAGRGWHASRFFALGSPRCEA